MSIKCPACLSGRSWECVYYGQCEQRGTYSLDPVSSDLSGDASLSLDYTEDREASGEADRDRISPDTPPGNRPGVPSREVNTYKDDSAIRDQQSTGRKRAAVMYPLDSEANCEWIHQKNCGGGNNPIVGCLNGKQQARHHGPDKNTLNNEQGNVHRICHNCHNRWHARNDDGYVWGSIYPLHEPSSATAEELINNEANWSGIVVKKARD